MQLASAETEPLELDLPDNVCELIASLLLDLAEDRQREAEAVTE